MRLLPFKNFENSTDPMAGSAPFEYYIDNDHAYILRCNRRTERYDLGVGVRLLSGSFDETEELWSEIGHLEMMSKKNPKSPEFIVCSMRRP